MTTSWIPGGAEGWIEYSFGEAKTISRIGGGGKTYPIARPVAARFWRFGPKQELWASNAVRPDEAADDWEPPADSWFFVQEIKG